MKEVMNIMENMCQSSIRGIVMVCLALLPIQNLMALYYPDIDAFYMVVLPFLMIFMLLNVMHTRRCKRMVQKEIFQNYQLLPVKNSSILISEFLFTVASYVLLVAIQYCSWALLYMQLKGSIPIQANTFFFYTLTNIWLNPIVMFQFYDIFLMLLTLALLAVNFMFLHFSIAMKDDRGIAILLTVICCIAMVALTLFPSAYLPLFIILIALSAFIINEMKDLLTIQRKEQSYEENN